jgi:hypothetical protein
MNFLEVAKGLDEGRVFKRPGWQQNEYLVKNWNHIQKYDAKQIEAYDLPIKEVLACDWEECRKENFILYHISTQYPTVYDEEGYAEYVVIPKDMDPSDWNYNELRFDFYNLKTFANWIDLEIDGGLRSSSDPYLEKALKEINFKIKGDVK